MDWLVTVSAAQAAASDSASATPSSGTSPSVPRRSRAPCADRPPRRRRRAAPPESGSRDATSIQRRAVWIWFRPLSASFSILFSFLWSSRSRPGPCSGIRSGRRPLSPRPRPARGGCRTPRSRWRPRRPRGSRGRCPRRGPGRRCPRVRSRRARWRPYAGIAARGGRTGVRTRARTPPVAALRKAAARRGGGAPGRGRVPFGGRARVGGLRGHRRRVDDHRLGVRLRGAVQRLGQQPVRYEDHDPGPAVRRGGRQLDAEAQLPRPAPHAGEPQPWHRSQLGQIQTLAELPGGLFAVRPAASRAPRRRSR